MKRRTLLAVATLAGLAPLSLRAATAFPSRTVRLIVTYAAGGGPDVFTRQIAPVLGEALNQTTIVENKVGAAGVLAAQYVAGTKADGYTLLQGSNTHLLQKILQPGLKFDPIGDFAPIGNMSGSPSVLVVAADAPYATVQDLVAAMRAAPGQLNYGSGGIGVAAHLAAATFVTMNQLDATHIPLRGSVEIALSLLRGDTQFAFPVTGTAVPQIEAGKLRALAVTSAERLPQLPEVPTLLELLGDDLAVQVSWSGLWAPASTPADVIDRLFEALSVTLASPAARAATEITGGSLMPSKSPQDYAAFIASENTKWRKIAQAAGLIEA